MPFTIALRTAIASCLVSVAGVVLAQAPTALPALPSSVPVDARVYVQTDARRPGRMVAWRGADGTLEVIFQQRDIDGCLTSIRSTILIDAVGVPVWLQHTGEMCRPAQSVDESYRRSGGMGHWRNHLERGEADVIGKKFYLSAIGLPEERAQLARALLSEGSKLVMLPSGQAWLESGRTLTLRAASRTETVTLYLIYGLGPEPSAIWLDSHGELFALGAQLIRQGWESSAAQLTR